MNTIFDSAFLLATGLLLTGCISLKAAAAPSAYRVYFGTSTKQEGLSGIYMSLLNMQTGQLSAAVRVTKTVKPGFITIHPNGRYIYSTSEEGRPDAENTGTVSAFRISEPDGALFNINTLPSEGAGPCHVSIDPSGKNVLAANYTGASCAVLPIQSDGSLASATAIQKNTGSSIHPKRQTKAYTHSINCDPAGHFAMVADLGIDQIMLYRFDADKGSLTPNDPPFVKTEPGGGPRHLTFHPSGQFAYVNFELSNKVTVFQYDAKKGQLTGIQTVSTLPDGFTGENTTSEIQTTPDGRFLYVANRGHNSLAVFAIDSATGKLTSLGHEPTRGNIPRHFRIDPTGSYLIAVNATSGDAAVFRINRTTGLLEFTGSQIQLPSPSCVQFLAVP
jgi:6-phosphogluconolactonase